MGPELVYQDIIMRIDGDILEVFRAGAHGRRTPLPWLVVRLEPMKHDRVAVNLGQKSSDQVMQNVDLPLYAWGKFDGAYPGLLFSIDVSEEPAFRAFFTEAAQACGRSVAQTGGP